jgi:hypothetical protein
VAENRIVDLPTGCLSRTALVDGKVTRHDLFRARDPLSA